MENTVTIGSTPGPGGSVPNAPAPDAPVLQLPVEGQLPAEGLIVTPSAVQRIRVILAKEGISLDEGGLRLGVKGGGCSGLSYSVGFDTQPRERDNIFRFEDVRVFIDPKSYVYLRGMKLDYEETLMRQGFNFINPNSARSCGCGTSFSV